MRILHAAETVRGGLATVISVLVRHQVDVEGLEVHCIAPNVHRSDVVGEHELIAFRRTGRNLTSLAAFTVTLVRALFWVRPDVVHLHSTFAGAIGRVVLLLMRPWHRPAVIYCPHGWSFIMAVSPWKRRLYAAIESLLAPLCSAIICVSEFEKDIAIAHGMPPEKLRVIPNGTTDPTETGKQPDKWDQCAPLRILYVGRFDREKGFDVLLAALERVSREVELTAVGGYVKDDKLPPHSQVSVTYTGWLEKQLVGDYYAWAHLVVVPSRWEAFGLAALEAMAHGVAVFASDAAALPELVTDYWNGRLFPPGDSIALAELIETADAAQLKTMGNNGRERFIDRYTSKSCAAATSELYARAREGADA